ncbi:MAG: hypothetical protein BIFFINMI_04145 [Phycisphaerae bacterium]|nr:hypothetical protein [Phycisphaerae bacterium]
MIRKAMRSLVRGVAVLALLAGGAVILTGCNTWQGFGQDVKILGEKMEGKPAHYDRFNTWHGLGEDLQQWGRDIQSNGAEQQSNPQSADKTS